MLKRLLLVFVLVLAACGTGDDADPTATPAPTQTPVPEPTATPIPQPGHPCFDLSDADCEIIVEAGDNAAAMTSFRAAFTIDVAVSGLEPLTVLVTVPNELTFNVSGQGALSLTTAETFTDLSLGMEITGTQDGETVLDTSIPVTATDGTLYLTSGGETVGVPFTAAALEALNLPLDLNEQIDFEALLDANPQTFGEFIMRDQLGVALNPSGTSIAAFADFVRLDDTETDHVFEFTLDASALLQSPDFTQALAAIGGGAADDPNVALGLQLLPVLLQEVESTIVITQYVGIEDRLINRLTFEFDFALDAGALLTGGDTDYGPITATVLFDITLSDINESLAIPAPARVRMLTVEELQMMLDEAVEDVETTIEDELAEMTPEVTPETTPDG
jgi:hypothetical protein